MPQAGNESQQIRSMAEGHRLAQSRLAGLGWAGAGDQLWLISNARERMSEIPILPTHDPAKPQPREGA